MTKVNEEYLAAVGMKGSVKKLQYRFDYEVVKMEQWRNMPFPTVRISNLTFEFGIAMDIGGIIEDAVKDEICASHPMPLSWKGHQIFLKMDGGVELFDWEIGGDEPLESRLIDLCSKLGLSKANTRKTLQGALDILEDEE
jgi:hypothetical protein